MRTVPNSAQPERRVEPRIQSGSFSPNNSIYGPIRPLSLQTNDEFLAITISCGRDVFLFLRARRKSRRLAQLARSFRFSTTIAAKKTRVSREVLRLEFKIPTTHHNASTISRICFRNPPTSSVRTKNIAKAFSARNRIATSPLDEIGLRGIQRPHPPCSRIPSIDLLETN